MAVDEYRRHCAELATAAARLDADIQSAEQSYVDSLTRLTGTVASAEAELSTMDTQLGRVHRWVGEVDTRAAALWGQAGELVGVRRLGPLPGPALSTVDEKPDPALNRVEVALRRYRVGPVQVRLPRWFVAVLPLLGVLGAVPTVLCGHLVGFDMAGVVLAPVPGWVAARRIVRQYGGWLDAAGTALTVFAALLASGIAAVIVR